MPTISGSVIASSDKILHHLGLVPGRKITRLSTNGWLIAVLQQPGSVIYYKSTDNGATWSILLSASISSIYELNGMSIASHGNMVYCALFYDYYPNSYYGAIVLHKFDATVGTLSTLPVLEGTVNIGRGISLAINNSGHLFLAWSARYGGSSSSTLSHNIYFSKSTNGGSTWTKANGTSGFDQLTSVNSSGQERQHPCITLDANGNPVIVYEALYNVSQNHLFVIECFRWTNSTWSGPITIYGVEGWALQSYNPQVIKQLNSNRLWCVWYGSNPNNSNWNIKIRKSDDNGATWSDAGVSGVNITTETSYSQSFPTITSDMAGNIHVCWHGGTPSSNGWQWIRMATWNGSSWSSITNLTTQTDHDTLFPSAVIEPINRVNIPLIIYAKNQGSTYTVIFTGSWSLAPLIWANINGVWKQAEGVWVNVGGVWKSVESLSVNIGGSWKQS